MCGIAGIISTCQYNSNNILDLLYHRGPDEQNVLDLGIIRFIHTRLSIQDIQKGKQPFTYKEYTIVFNGEIYNHIELRKKLKEFEFKTNSDTETLLYLFIKFKEQMFRYIDGMFAFAVWDNFKKKLFLSVDRAGKKPLYYFKKDNEFIFASEINAIASIKQLEVNEEAIYSYLKTGFFYKDFSPFNNVRRIKAGTFAEYDFASKNITERKYFDIKDFYLNKKNINLKESLEILDDKLKRSVKDRLFSSDVEVGAFLSGGIDSSLIVAIASEYTKLKTFTVKFEDGYDESHLARLTANRYNTEHYELKISMALKNDIDKILQNYGIPFMDSSAIPSYYVSREARKYVKVILNGDGADEMFAGYRRYVPVANNYINIAKKMRFITKFLPFPNEKKSFYNYIFRLLTMSGKKGLDFYISATNDIFEDIYDIEKNDKSEEINRFILQVLNNRELTELSKFLYLDFELILFSDLLVKMDIATMSNSLEGRSPFLSKYILEFAPQLSDNLKISGWTTKYILRELAKKYLPKELINQSKRGFEVPLKKWVDNELKENIFDSLSGNSYGRNFISGDFISKLLNNKINISREKRAKMLWILYTLEVWKKNILL